MPFCDLETLNAQCHLQQILLQIFGRALPLIETRINLCENSKEMGNTQLKLVFPQHFLLV